MAIFNGTIRVRRGLESDFDESKMVSGELAIATDKPVIWFCWKDGTAAKIEGTVTSETLKKYFDEWNGDSNILIDETLSKTGQAADAKVTGEQITELKSDIGQISEEIAKLTGADPEVIKEAVIEYLDENGVSISDIEDATIYDLPSDLVAQPVFSNINYVNTTLNDVLVKPAVIQYGGYIFFPNTKNIDGGTGDLPTISGTGVTAVVYRKFRWSNNSALSDTTGTIAQKGDSYIDYQGNNAVFDGGVGYSSALRISDYEGKVYFSAVTSGRNGVKINESVQSFVPCCVDITINSDTPIGTIYELTLDINGETGRFDLARLGYTDYYSYYTTVAPCYSSNAYHIALAVPDGIVYCTSTDGINWTYVRTYKTEFEPRYEIATAVGNGGLCFACRAPYDDMHMYICWCKNTSQTTIKKTYRIQDVGSRPCLTAIGSNFYLMHSSTSRDVCEVLQIIRNKDYGLYFYRWFTMYGNMTYYPIMSCISTTNEVNAFKSFMIVGNNGIHTAMTGISWARVTCNTNKPFTADACIYPAITADSPGGAGAYTVTNNLTNCTTSNNSTSIEEGAEYSATITAIEGYELAEVTCTMGGVTQTVTDGVISISEVTGDIIVTATAAEKVVMGSLPFNDLSQMILKNSMVTYADGIITFTISANTINNNAETNPALKYSDYKGETVRISATMKSDGTTISNAGLYAWLSNTSDVSSNTNSRVKYSRALLLSSLTTEYQDFSVDFVLDDSSFTLGSGTITGEEYLTFGVYVGQKVTIDMSVFSVEVVE